MNSHKNLVEELEVFGSKFKFLNELKYVTDINQVTTEIANIKRRGLVYRLINVSLEERSTYNMILTYGFSIIDKVGQSQGEVIDSEEGNIFTMGALEDYLNYILDNSATFSNITTDSSLSDGKTETLLDGNFSVIIKRKPSFWREMESYQDD